MLQESHRLFESRMQQIDSSATAAASARGLRSKPCYADGVAARIAVIQQLFVAGDFKALDLLQITRLQNVIETTFGSLGPAHAFVLPE